VKWASCRIPAQSRNLGLGFFDELKSRFGAPGEFAQAYVIAHEIGHHVQKLLGIESRVQRMRQNNPSEANPLSVRLELQADCFAGVWAKSTKQRKIIDQSDVAQPPGRALTSSMSTITRDS
jgi:uncharacterized protein